MSSIKKIALFALFIFMRGVISFTKVYAQEPTKPNFGGIIEQVIGEPSKGLKEFKSATSEVNLNKKVQDFAIDNSTGGERIRDFLSYIGVKVMIPIFIFAGIIIAIIGFYKLFASSSDEELQKARKYILRGVIGVIIMVSAGYITNMLAGTDGTGGILGGIIDGSSSGTQVAEKVYTNIIFPFLKIAMYVIIGILFILVIIHAFKYIFNDGEELQKQSVSILIYNTVGILIIILAKSLVESVYGKYDSIINNTNQNVGNIGTGIFNTLEFGTLYLIINWILGLVTFIILILLVYQGYMLMMNPNDEEMAKKLKKSLGYIFIGILIIGAGYLIVNFFIIT